MRYNEIKCVEEILRAEGLDYGLRHYTDFKDEVQDAEFHEVRNSYDKANVEGNFVGKAEAIVKLTKLMDIDVFKL